MDNKKEMTQEREGRILEGAIAKYGENAQVDMMLEEMSELTKALLKYRRAMRFGGDVAKAKDAILEEMADVSIMLNQMELIFGDCTSHEVAKLERLEERLQK